MKKVKCFCCDNYKPHRMEQKINDFSETHNILQISYSVTKACLYCMVLYEESSTDTHVHDMSDLSA